MPEVWYWDVFGLGDDILALSVLNNIGQPIILCVPEDIANKIQSLITCLCFNNLKLQVVDESVVKQRATYSSIDGRGWTWDLINMQRANGTIEYHTPKVINVYDQYFSTDSKKKRCIALAMNNGKSHIDVPEEYHTQLPYNKYYSQHYWHQVIDLIVKSGYDYIAINSKEISIEQKIFLLNEFCDAVIGYEGGLCHLAHVLRIPTLILPWNNTYLGEDGVQEVRSLHYDTRTWLLESGDELLNWDSNQLQSMIKTLKENNGNHPMNVRTTDDILN